MSENAFEIENPIFFKIENPIFFKIDNPIFFKIDNPIFFKIDNPIFFKIDDVISWCEEVVNSCKDFNFDVFSEKNPSKFKEFVECCKDLLEECIYLNESVFLKDKTIRIRKVRFDNNEVWIGEWEEMLDRMRDGMVGYYRFGESGQRVLDEIENNKNCGRDWVKM